MKKLMLIAVCCCLSGCTNATDATDDLAKTEVTVLSNDWQSNKVDTSEDVSDWGIRYKSAVIDNDGNAMRYYINFPVSVGNDRASGRIGFQDGYVLAMVAQRYNDAYDIQGNIENVFPTCFPQAIKILEADQTATAYDYAFDITDQKLEEINGYQMCRYEGNLTYVYDHIDFHHRYVAYATEVADGAYVFWMLIDESEDNSSFDLASEYALKMAYTLRTEE